MKQLENKTTTIEKENGKCLYSDLINLVIKQGKQGGFGYDDIEQRLAIGSKTKEANGFIDLEDAQFNYLKKLVNDMKWNVVHESIIQFRNDINAVK